VNLLEYPICVIYTSIDGYCEIRTFQYLEQARTYAQEWIGPHPEEGFNYAVSPDGVGKIEVTGIELKDLFPESIYAQLFD
jgi:hypothetical protein